MKAIVANSLLEGEVVYWKSGAWKPSFADAEIFSDDETAESALAKANDPLIVVDCYLIDVADEGEGYAPMAFRERIKALGPPNHPTHGKQAEGGDWVEAIKHSEATTRSGGRINLIKRK